MEGGKLVKATRHRSPSAQAPPPFVPQPVLSAVRTPMLRSESRVEGPAAHSPEPALSAVRTPMLGSESRVEGSRVEGPAASAMSSPCDPEANAG